MASAKASKNKTIAKRTGRKTPRKLSTANKGGRPVKWKTAAEMQTEIDHYYLECDVRQKDVLLKNGSVITIHSPKPYTVQGLAVALDLTREGLREYGLKGTFSATIKRAKAIIEENKVAHMLDGDGPVAGYIFDLKNNYGWTDKHEISGPGGGPIVRDDLAGMTNEELEKRLKLLTGGNNAK